MVAYRCGDCSFCLRFSAIQVTPYLKSVKRLIKNIYLQLNIINKVITCNNDLLHRMTNINVVVLIKTRRRMMMRKMAHRGTLGPPSFTGPATTVVIPSSSSSTSVDTMRYFVDSSIGSVFTYVGVVPLGVYVCVTVDVGVDDAGTVLQLVVAVLVDNVILVVCLLVVCC